MDPGPANLSPLLRSRLSSTTEQFDTPGHISHELLAQLIALSSQAFAIGFPDGSLGLINSAFEKLTGYTAQELQHISWATTLTPPEWREFERQKVEELNATGKPVRYEKEYLRKDGTRVPVELHVHKVPDPSGELYYFSFLTDISERKKAEEDLVASEARFREVLETSVHCIYRYNIPDRRYDYMSPSSERIMGYTPQEMLNISIEEGLDMVHPVDRVRVQQAIADLAFTGEIEVEYQFKFKSGEYRWLANRMLLVFDEAGKAIYRRGAIRDFTDSKRTEDELNRTRERFRSVLDNSVDGVYRFNYISRHYDYASPSFEHVIGYSAEEFMEMSEKEAFALVHPDDFKTVVEQFKSLKPNGRTELMYRHKNKSGEYQWLSNHLTLTVDQAGAPLYRYGNIRNVTAQKIAEEELAVSRHVLADLAAKQQRISETVQRSLLLAPAPDAYPGLTAQPFYLSASDDALVGGDFYDIFPVGNDLIMLVVGDATGKGIAAATYTAEVKFALRGYMKEHAPDLSHAITMLNRFIYDNIELDAAHKTNAFVALACALLNVNSGELVCVCAGAEPPIIVHEASGVLEEGCEFGPLLGVAHDSIYTPSTFQLYKGDLITLTTDGITEAHEPIAASHGSSNGRNVFFGIDGVAELIRAANPVSSESINTLQQSIAAEAIKWAGGRQRDDICLLTAKLT